MSFAGHGKCPSYLQSAINQASSMGSILIAAAGNDGLASIANTFPANCDNVISVAPALAAAKSLAIATETLR
jgi:serine protease